MPATPPTTSTDVAVRPLPPPPPPPAPPVLVRHWPEPPPTSGPVPLAAACGAGVLAAALVPLGRPGLGWALAGLAVCVAVTVGVRRPGGDPATSTRWRRLEAATWGLVAVAALGVGALRAAGWLFALCLLAAAAAAVLALTGGRTVRGLAFGALLVPAAAGRGAGWAFQGAAILHRRVRPAVRLLPTAAATALVLLVFGALLGSADAEFSRLLGRAVPDLPVGTALRAAHLFPAAAGLVLAAVFLLVAPPDVDRMRPARGDGVRVGTAEWAIPVGALVGLFAGFVGVQLSVLFGGSGYVRGPDGPTYAEHARGGFWQLLTVTVLTLLVIGVVARVAPRGTRTARWWLRGLLGALAALSLVIVASALFRMHTYQEAYGFTRLRVLVSLVELWLGLLFLLVLVAGVRLRAGWLPRAVVATGVAAVLALAALNPDRFIAERNVDRWEGGERLDVSYLAGLSADAVPVLVCLPEPHRGRALAGPRERLAEPADDWRSVNLSRATARELLAAGPPPDCPG